MLPTSLLPLSHSRRASKTVRFYPAPRTNAPPLGLWPRTSPYPSPRRLPIDPILLCFAPSHLILDQNSLPSERSFSHPPHRGAPPGLKSPQAAPFFFFFF